MEHTPKNMIKVLLAMQDNASTLARMYEEEHKTIYARREWERYMTLEIAINVIASKNMFDGYVEIYDVKEDGE